VSLGASPDRGCAALESRGALRVAVGTEIRAPARSGFPAGAGRAGPIRAASRPPRSG